MSDMDKTYTVRLANLRRLVEMTEGGAAELARVMGHANRSFISQLSGVNPTRKITEKTARNVETAMGLPAGWMDIVR